MSPIVRAELPNVEQQSTDEVVTKSPSQPSFFLAFAQSEIEKLGGNNGTGAKNKEW